MKPDNYLYAAVSSGEDGKHDSTFHVFAADFGGFTLPSRRHPGGTYASPAAERFPPPSWQSAAFCLAWMCLLLLDVSSSAEAQGSRARLVKVLSSQQEGDRDPVVAGEHWAEVCAGVPGAPQSFLTLLDTLAGFDPATRRFLPWELPKKKARRASNNRAAAAPQRVAPEHTVQSVRQAFDTFRLQSAAAGQH